MPQHPDAYVRRSVRLMAMVGELHKRGYQRLRVMPYFGPTGHWRGSIAPVLLFYRNHGAIHLEPEGGVDAPEVAMVARYTGAAGSHYFEWNDAGADTARSLADKFIDRFPLLSMNSQGWDYPYAGWYLRLLGTAERGWLPCLRRIRGNLVREAASARYPAGGVAYFDRGAAGPASSAARSLAEGL
jgi:hypothetical protein